MWYQYMHWSSDIASRSCDISYWSCDTIHIHVHVHVLIMGWHHVLSCDTPCDITHTHNSTDHTSVPPGWPVCFLPEWLAGRRTDHQEGRTLKVLCSTPTNKTDHLGYQCITHDLTPSHTGIHARLHRVDCMNRSTGWTGFSQTNSSYLIH